MAASARQMVMQLKETDTDYQWYPTDQHMIDVIKKDIEDNFYYDNPSVLDCGAGDGRVLEALTKGSKYAIEKARPLLNSLDKNIFVVGTDFNEQTLLDKRTDITFANPPYSEYEYWATKIIKEANSSLVYLIIPTRWKNSLTIKEAIEVREAKTTVLGEFDFLNADRKARAVVNILKIELGYKHQRNALKTDPFAIWFNEFFKADINKTEQSEWEQEKAKKETLNEKLQQGLVKGSNIVSVLEELYQHELQHLIATYRSLSEVDADILKELDVNIEGVQAAMSQRISGLKDRFWRELFNNLNTVTDKLTKKSRESLLSTLTRHTHVDFTSSNAHAVVSWVVRNANDYFNDQLVNMAERMTEKANVINYVSNQRTYGRDDWRYCKTPEDLQHYKLDYRIVLERVGGVSTSSWSHQAINGLTHSAADFIEDLRTIATNLGFNTYGLETVRDYDWESNAQKEFSFRNIHTGEIETLFTVRAFKNQNLHIKFCQRFIIRLNCEFGRLKGWLKSAEQAASELNTDIAETQSAFGSNIQLTSRDVPALEFNRAV